ncbi:hypothetical protein KTE68_22270 [Burkholderia multivorans]|uniref:hypothetical protein n=1 Tax=Burkholderia multivorans TaxID=87883 RepID=UPI001C2187F5|nr:hypothetical protein [Burkholderia multivorans]MBU9502880.1 hypothetical protein [Burkholderia multivorans]
MEKLDELLREYAQSIRRDDGTAFVHADAIRRLFQDRAVASPAASVPAGWKLVPIEPTESMVVEGFESWPDQFFSDPEAWAAYEKMTACQKAAHKARLCYAAMLAAAPQPAQADAPAVTHPPAKIDTKARMDWADSIVRKLPPLDPTYSIVGSLEDHDPEDRDEVLHSIRTFADMRATQALFALCSATADAGEAREPAAWVTPDGDRAITQRQKQAMLRDGGASASSVRSYSIRCYADSDRVDPGKVPTHRCITCGAEGNPNEVIGCSACGFDDMQPLAMDIAALPAAGEARLTAAARDVLSERRRQIEAEGWTPDHDDEHDNGEMACAAACYALAELFVFDMSGLFDKLWPSDWSRKWWKPTTKRRNLVKAGGLILAEIERIDRTGGDE